MLHSGYSAAAQGRCRLRQDAGAVPRSEYGRWPDSQPARSEPEIPGSVDSQVTGSQRSNEYKGGFSGELYINEMNKLAKDTQTGNCSELSAVAFNYLKLRGVRPLDYFGIFRGGWNHAFVVLNRDATTPIPDFAKWSEYAVLCDPLYDRSADAGFLATWYPRIYPFKPSDLVYRLE